MKTQKIEALNMKQNNNHETRIALLEQSNLNINETLKEIKHALIRLESKVDESFEKLDKKIDVKFESLDKKIDGVHSSLDKKIDGIHARIWTLFMWGIGAFAAVLGLIAHAEKWI